jgi:broad specificity phosphatase PhoE
MVRHLEKQWDNNKKPKDIVGFQLDPPLAPGQLVQSIPKCSLIITSPYRRCHETAVQISKATGAPILCMEIFREYLGNQRQEREVTAKEKIHPDTLAWINGKLIETMPQFNQRVNTILNTFEHWDKDDIAIVTHGIIIKDLTGVELGPGRALQWQPKKL